jgi:hypothetical protein
LLRWEFEALRSPASRLARGFDHPAATRRVVVELL